MSIPRGRSRNRGNRTVLFAAIVLAGCACGAAVSAAEAPAKKDSPTGPPAGPIHTVQREPFAIKVTLNGVFEAQQMAELALRPKAWSGLSVLEAVEPGARVRKGDRLVQLDTEKIDQAIDDLETILQLSGLSLKQAEDSLALLEKTIPMDMARAKREMEEADEDLLRFLKVELPRSEKSAHYSIKSSENYLEYEMEELRQLEKMYKADDLTEETEEIILKRQRDAVDRMKFSLEGTRITSNRVLEVDLPRQEESMKDSTRRQSLSGKKTLENLPLTLKQSRLELLQKKTSRARSEDKLKKLRGDRAAMSVKSPADGIVYYGQCVNGTWQNQASNVAKLKQGGSIQPSSVFMTIVQPHPLFIRASVPENQLHNIRPGLRGRVVPTGFPEKKLTARVRTVSGIPAAGEYGARISIDPGEGTEEIMPGMTCSLHFTSYFKKNAITIPASALEVEEEGVEEKTFVQVIQDGKQEKRAVKVGKRSGEKVEVLEGLKEGDRILLKKAAS